MDQEPAKDGKRYTRFAIIRETLAQLKSTVLKDFLDITKGAAVFMVSKSEIYIKDDELDCEIMLVPLADPEDQKRLLSSQLTGAWFSEVIEIDVDLIGPVAGRVGRYPNGDKGAPTWSGLIADTNFPVEGSQWWKFMEFPSTEWEIFKQPSGLSDDAENLQWLNQTSETLKLPEDHPDRIARGRQYYVRLIATSTKTWSDRYVRAVYSPDPSGTAVYTNSFRRGFHVRPELSPLRAVCSLWGRTSAQSVEPHCADGPAWPPASAPRGAGHRHWLDLHLRQNLRPTLMDPRGSSCIIPEAFKIINAETESSAGSAPTRSLAS